MVRMGARATAELVSAARQGVIGGVILFPPSGVQPEDVSAEVQRLQRAAAKGGNPPLLVATDQEGGEVKRFRRRAPSALAGAARRARR